MEGRGFDVKLAVDSHLFAVFARGFEGRLLEANLRDTDDLRALCSKDSLGKLSSALEGLHAPPPLAGISPIHSAGHGHVDNSDPKNQQRERHAGSVQEGVSG
jgi:hypothetical protein